MFNNEASFLLSWSRHYLERGIEHVYLLDDRSTDDYEDIIREFAKDGSATLKKVHPDDPNRNIEWRQVHLYNSHFGFAKDEATWLGVFDLDEFFYSPKTKDTKTPASTSPLRFCAISTTMWEPETTTLKKGQGIVQQQQNRKGRKNIQPDQ